MMLDATEGMRHLNESAKYATGRMRLLAATQVAERLRMCLAEAGYVDGVDGHLIVELDDDDRYGIWWAWRGGSGRPVPDEVLWRARETADVEVPCCLKHFEAFDTDACRASVRFVKDCGT